MSKVAIGGKWLAKHQREMGEDEDPVAAEPPVAVEPPAQRRATYALGTHALSKLSDTEFQEFVAWMKHLPATASGSNPNARG